MKTRAVVLIFCGMFLLPQSGVAQIVGEKSDINIGSLLADSMRFLAVQHGYRVFYEEKTREKLGGNFFNDWFRSVRVSGWDDGGRFFTNYVAHPMMGSTSAFIFANNDRVSQEAEFWSKDYFRAKKRQLIFSVIFSEQFELGPISESSIGNIGQQGKQTWVDHVITPTVGVAWSIGEDAVDAAVLEKMRKNHPNWANGLSVILTPTKTMANLVALRKPWHRD